MILTLQEEPTIDTANQNHLCQTHSVLVDLQHLKKCEHIRAINPLIHYGLLAEKRLGDLQPDFKSSIK